MPKRVPHRALATAVFSFACAAQQPSGGLAQSPAPRLEFDVASVKPNPSGRPGYGIRALPGRLTANNISLKRLIAMAYSVTDFQIFGSLNWLESERFDVEAKSPGPAELPQLRLMTRSLLEDRFQLKFHREPREMAIYFLVLAKPGIKGGPGLVESPAGDCENSLGPQPAPAKGARIEAPCGTVNPMPGRIFGKRGRISQLADRLSTLLGRTVVDKTGLQGVYDIELEYTPDPELMSQLPSGQPPPDTSGPSLFTAIENQLGLKLQAGRGPVDSIVIDSAEKPTGN
jgi:uncharacterized protein (TIGR03435 family)